MFSTHLHCSCSKNCFPLASFTHWFASWHRLFSFFFFCSFFSLFSLQCHLSSILVYSVYYFFFSFSLFMISVPSFFFCTKLYGKSNIYRHTYFYLYSLYFFVMSFFSFFLTLLLGWCALSLYYFHFLLFIHLTFVSVVFHFSAFFFYIKWCCHNYFNYVVEWKGTWTN